MKTKSWIVILLVFAAVLCGAYVLYDRLAPEMDGANLATQSTTEETETVTESTPKATTNMTEGTVETTKPTVPDFTVYDAAGNPVRLSDFAGKPLIVNFWASWCGPCKSEMPDFQAAFEELGDEVQFLMVNMTDGSRETVETASAFIAEQGYTFPVYFDTDYSASNAYSVYSLPSTFFFDAEGTPVARATGAISGEVLQQGIDMIYTVTTEPVRSINAPAGRSLPAGAFMQIKRGRLAASSHEVWNYS